MVGGSAKCDMFLAIPDNELVGLTKDQIVKRCNVSYSTFGKWYTKYRRPYRRLYERRRGGSGAK
jgi:transposase